MNTLMTRRQPLIAVAVVVYLLVLVAGWFLLISPKRAEVADLRGKVQTQESSNSSLQAQIANLEALAAKLPAQRAALAAVSAKVPQQPAIPELVRNLNQAAVASNVTLTGIKPVEPTAIPGADGVQGIDVTLTVNGDYVSLEQYHLALEGLSRAFLVQGMTITEKSSSGSSSAPGATSTGGSSSDTGGLTATISGRVLVGAPTGTSTSSSSKSSTSSGSSSSAPVEAPTTSAS